MKMKIFDFFMISMIEIKIVVPVIGCRQTCYEIASKTGWVHFLYIFIKNMQNKMNGVQ